MTLENLLRINQFHSEPPDPREFSRSRTRILTVCHEKRNLAEYEGCFEIDEQLLGELIDCTRALYKKVSEIQL